MAKPEQVLSEGVLNYGDQQISCNGDAYVKLYPFPRVPVDIILWLEDEEFSPKVDLFLIPHANYSLLFQV